MPDMDWTPVYNEFMRLIKENYTNEEWFCALPTKDKAKFLEAQQKHGGTIAARSDVDWEVWLKEIHHDD